MSKSNDYSDRDEPIVHDRRKLAQDATNILKQAGLKWDGQPKGSVPWEQSQFERSMTPNPFGNSR